MYQPWFWGENCIHSFIYVFTIQQAFQVFLKLRGHGDCWLSTSTFFTPAPLPHPRYISSYRDLVSAILFQKWPFRGHQWLLPIQLLLIWLFCRFGLDWASSASLELYALGLLFSWWPLAVALTELSSIFTQDQRFYEEISLVPFYCLLALFFTWRNSPFPPVSFSFTYHS